MAVKVFVSSTYIDLKDHRQRVIAQLRRAGYQVDPMEDWTSDADEPKRFSLDRLDGCQACVLLVGFRRGFVPAGQARSITQMEYDHAIARGIAVLPFLLDDRVTGWPEPYDDRTHDPLLKEWREYLGLHHGIEQFTAEPTSVDVLPAVSRWQARQYARDQMKAAGYTPAGQLQLNHLTVGGDLTMREGTIQPYVGDTRRSDPASRNRRAMIEKVWAIWITGVLQPSLPHDILLDLGLTELPAMVTRALDLLVQPDLADRVQAPGTPLIDVFDRLDRALLMLGAPGAGKTTLLLQLARDLLQRAAEDPEQPIPVVFPLSSWAARRRPLGAWLVGELQQRYDVPRRIGQAWIDADQVLPLLDGLDEVQAEYRAVCADAINTFRQDHGLLPLAVCSRITEYDDMGVQLRLQGAIIVQPLTRAQVDNYLTQIGEPLAAVRQVLQEDPQLWELLDTPLMLTIVTLAYTGQSAEALRTRGTLIERRQSLFATYVDRMLQRRSAVTRYTRQQTERWLAWLGSQLAQHNQSAFYLEHLQPDWLPVGRRWLPTHGARLLAGLVGALLGALGGALRGGLLGTQGGALLDTLEGGLLGTLGGALVGGLVGALIGGLTGYAPEITPIEMVRWSWSRFLAELFLPSLHGLRGGLRGGLGAALGAALLVALLVAFGIIPIVEGGALLVRLATTLVAALVAALLVALLVAFGIILVSWLGVGLGAGLIGGVIGGLGTRLGTALDAALGTRLGTVLDAALGALLVLGLGAGLAYKLGAGLAAGLSGGEITTKTRPNEGIHRSARMAVISGLGSGLVGGLVGAFGIILVSRLGVRLTAGLSAGLSVGLLVGLGVGLATGLRYGGRACLQHLVLRLALRYDDCMPRRYADFLDYAAERLFLRRVGGGYIFIHRLLQDHFATRYQSDRVDSPPQPPPPPP